MSTTPRLLVTALFSTAILALAGCNNKVQTQPIQIGEPSATAGSASQNDVAKLPPIDSNDRYPAPTVVNPPAQPTPIPPLQPPTVIDQAPPPPAAPLTGGKIHTIAKGDTYWSLARTYYGDPKQWKKIQDANPDVRYDKLKIGQKILIPD